MYFTYVVNNPKNRTYTGSTANVAERLEMHNDMSPEKAKFHRTTYKKGPWEIIFSKEFKTRREALEFEKFLKTGIGREWLPACRQAGRALAAASNDEVSGSTPELPTKFDTNLKVI
jgi:putative endonuclease